MYVWQFGIDDNIIIGRTWEGFVRLIDWLSDKFKTNAKSKRIIVYVHNLSYEFQFIQKLFEWYKVFAVDNRRPVYAITNTGIEFRCSYILSGYRLETVGKNLTKYKVEKKSGDLDYNLIRNSQTPLTEAERGYIINDIAVIISYIRELMERDGDVTKIPLTQTGYIRKYCKDNTIGKGNDDKSSSRYKRLMSIMTLEEEEYKQLQRAFAGGFTHCSWMHSGDTLNDVASYDFTSSYPAVMLACKFPMSKAEKVAIKSSDEFEYNLSKYCCLFDIEIRELEPIIDNEHIISYSKCFECEDYVIDNGRIVTAKRLRMTITDVDFKAIKQFYKWKSYSIGSFRRYRKGYLPTEFIKSILKLYYDKTELKGVGGYEAEYMHSKEMLNSCYGMCCTASQFRDSSVFNDHEWSVESVDLLKELNKYNKAKNRFLFFPWGVWVTSYARYNLFTAIKELGYDYIYSDTDSVKLTNYKNHIEYFDNYNRWITNRIDKAMNYHGITDYIPCTIKGVPKPIGVWDFESVYKRFKSLGAKRYIVDTGDSCQITVSGVNKFVASDYLNTNYKDPFSIFNDGYIFSGEATGKNTLTYIDEETEGYVTDYLGNEAYYHELSSIHMEACEYALDRSLTYIKFLTGRSIHLD